MKHSHSCHSMPSVQQQTDINKPDQAEEAHKQAEEINPTEKSEKSSPSPINFSEKSFTEHEIQTPSPPSSENTTTRGSEVTRESGWARSGFGSGSEGHERRDSETKIVVASTCSLNNDQEAL